MNVVSNYGSINKKEIAIFSILMNPFAPHVTEEVWEACKLGDGILAQASWPQFDESKCVDDTVEIVVQVNGKIKAKLMIPADADQATAISLAKADEKVIEAIGKMNIVKEIYVKGKLVNIVVKP